MDSAAPGAQRSGRRGRLSHAAEFDRVMRRGRARSNRFFVLHVFPRADGGTEARLGLSVSRRVGSAVVRNRLKRLIREVFRGSPELWPSDHDVVVVARSEARGLAEREGLEGVRRELASLAPAGTGA